jgi:4,5-dihydroxyphthalate decarboxylase
MVHAVRRAGKPFRLFHLTRNSGVTAFDAELSGHAPASLRPLAGLRGPGARGEDRAVAAGDMWLENLPPGATISSALADGTLDALIGPRAPSCLERGHPHVGRLWPDPIAVASER